MYDAVCVKECPTEVEKESLKTKEVEFMANDEHSIDSKVMAAYNTVPFHNYCLPDLASAVERVDEIY